MSDMQLKQETHGSFVHYTLPPIEGVVVVCVEDAGSIKTYKDFRDYATNALTRALGRIRDLADSATASDAALQRAIGTITMRAASAKTMETTPADYSALYDMVYVHALKAPARFFEYVQEVARLHPEIPLLGSITAPLTTVDALLFMSFIATHTQRKDEVHVQLLMDKIM